MPPPRELDMLMTAGERISMALVAMAISDLGFSARSFTGSQAGVITDGVHGRAKIIDVTPGRITEALGKGHIVIVAGFQGVSQGTKEITTLGRGGTDTTAVALAAALRAEVCEIYTDVDGVFTADPRIVPAARKIDRISNEEMLELAAVGLQGAAPAQRRVRPALRHPHPRAVVVLPQGGHDRHGPARTRRRRRGSPDHRRSGPRPQRGQGHRRRRARPPRHGRADLRGGDPGADQHRHDRAERLGHRHRPAPTSRSRCPRPTAPPRSRRCSGSRARSGSPRSSTTTRSASSRWSAPACAPTPASRRRSSRRSPTRASTSR